MRDKRDTEHCKYITFPNASDIGDITIPEWRFLNAIEGKKYAKLAYLDTFSSKPKCYVGIVSNERKVIYPFTECEMSNPIDSNFIIKKRIENEKHSKYECSHLWIIDDIIHVIKTWIGNVYDITDQHICIFDQNKGYALYDLITGTVLSDYYVRMSKLQYKRQRNGYYFIGVTSKREDGLYFVNIDLNGKEISIPIKLDSFEKEISIPSKTTNRSNASNGFVKRFGRIPNKLS